MRNPGLPNITGKAGAPYSRDNANINGAFSCVSTGDAGGFAAASQYKNLTWIDFDASRSNAIYGNNTTVQPPALTVRYYIKF